MTWKSLPSRRITGHKIHPEVKIKLLSGNYFRNNVVSGRYHGVQKHLPKNFSGNSCFGKFQFTFSRKLWMNCPPAQNKHMQENFLGISFLREYRRGLYSHSREIQEILLRDHFPHVTRTHVGANTCRACIRTRANTGKNSERTIYYVLVSCQGAFLWAISPLLVGLVMFLYQLLLPPPPPKKNTEELLFGSITLSLSPNKFGKLIG